MTSGSTGDALYTEPDPTPWLGQRMTPEEFLKLPEFKPYLELFEGIVVQKAYADPPHGLLQLELTRGLDGNAQARRLGMAFLELTTCFAGSVVIPDVAYVRADRVPIDPVRRRFRREHVRTPDLAAVIMHMGQRRAGIARRSHWYVENGVLVSLLVDPNDDTVSIFRPNAATSVLRGDDRIEIDEVLPGFNLTVRSLFARTYADWWGAADLKPRRRT